MRARFIFFLTIFIFFGCAKITPRSSKAINFTIISPLIRLSDAGFMHYYANQTNVQIYNSGISVLNLVVRDNKICMNNACDDELVFNKKFFKNEYYKGLLSQILHKQKIFGGANYEKTECGFTQNISKTFIKYKKCNDVVIFNDTKNGIKIILKELD